MTANQRRLMIDCLIAVNLLIPVATILLRSWSRRAATGVEISFGIALNIIAAQWLLLTIWAVLGSAKIRVRIAGWVVGCAVGTLGISVVRLSEMGLFELTDVWAGMMITARTAIPRVIALTIALILMWFDGLCLVHFEGRIESSGSDWPQFSLQQLLALMGCVAVVLGGRSLAHSFGPATYFGGWLVSGLFNEVGLAVVTCVLLRATLSPAPTAMRVGMSLILAVMIFLAKVYHPRSGAASYLGFAIGTLIELAWVVGSLLVVRACGYRALWPSDWVWAAAHADQIELSSND